MDKINKLQNKCSTNEKLVRYISDKNADKQILGKAEVFQKLQDMIL